MDRIKKIVLTGPESSGKSLLTRELAKYFNTNWAPEYARIYFEKNKVNYSYPLLLIVSQVHKSHQLKYISKSKELIFLDTDLINYKIWCDVVYNKTHKWVINNIQKENDHRYLITYPDVKWKLDPLRQNPNDRIRLFDRHLREIAVLKRPYRVIKGMGSKRLSNAITLAKELLSLS